jgi:glycyl-tRNA synthetase beta chain
VKILADLRELKADASVDLNELLEEAFVHHEGSNNDLQAVSDFLWERTAHLYESRGSQARELRAVRSADSALYETIRARLDAYKQNRRSDAFKSLAALFKRVKNITNNVVDDGRELSELRTVLKEPAELALLDAMAARWLLLDEAEAAGRFGQVVETFAELQPFVDSFFNSVLVMTDDQTIREARLMLLVRLRRAVVRKIGDISEIAGEDDGRA